jgi:hypothetical protein
MFVFPTLLFFPLSRTPVTTRLLSNCDVMFHIFRLCIKVLLKIYLYYYYYLLLLLFTAIGFSPGGSSPYTITHNTNVFTRWQ